MKYCTKCGFENVDTSAFCASCGEAFVEETPAVEQAPVAEQTPPVVNPAPQYQAPQYQAPQYQAPPQPAYAPTYAAPAVITEEMLPNELKPVNAIAIDKNNFIRFFIFFPLFYKYNIQILKLHATIV